MAQELILTCSKLSSLITAQNRPINPASVYLASLGSNESRRVMSSYLSIMARMAAGLTKHRDMVSTYHDYPWGTLRRAHITAIVGLLNESGRSPATVNTYLHALKGVAREAWALNQMTSDENAHIERIKPVRGSRLSPGRVLTSEDMRSLLNTTQADRSEIGVRDYAMLLLLLSAGLRRTEIVTLNCSSINLGAHKIHILGKGNKERIAYIDDNCAIALKYWMEQVLVDDSGSLFCRIRKGGNMTGERLTAQSVLYILQKRCAKAGIGKASPHDLRRTYATMMIEDGEDLITIRDSMGHASVETTQRYICLNDDKRRKASSRLGKRISNLTS